MDSKPLQWQYPPAKLIYILNKIPINIPDDYILAEIDKFILKLIELQGTPK